MKASQVSSASTAELVAFYNEFSPKSVSRFSDRAAAEKRVTALIESNSSARGCPKCGAHHDQTAAGLEGTAAEERNVCHHCSTEYFPDTGRIYRAPAGSAARGEAIAKSWGRPEVRAARCERTMVRVRVGRKVEEFPSVAAAFRKLGLPLSRHIAFRMSLKAAGELAWNDSIHFTAATV